MAKKTKSNDESNTIDDKSEKENDNNLHQKSKIRISKPMIAGILLITAGMISIMALIPYLTIDDVAIDDLRENDSEFNKYAENKTNEQIKNEYASNGTMGIIISISPILGGIFALIKKGWIISLFGGIIGILFSAVVISIILSLVAFLLIVFSRKEFQQNIDFSFFKRKKED